MFINEQIRACETWNSAVVRAGLRWANLKPRDPIRNELIGKDNIKIGLQETVWGGT
jgi:hypothetical protein